MGELKTIHSQSQHMKWKQK